MHSVGGVVVNRKLLHRLDNRETVDNLGEDAVSVKSRTARSESGGVVEQVDEKLGAAAVGRSGARQTNRPHLVGQRVLERHRRGGGPVVLAALNDKRSAVLVTRHAIEKRVFVKTGFREVDEVGDSLGGVLGEELEGDDAVLSQKSRLRISSGDTRSIEEGGSGDDEDNR